MLNPVVNDFRKIVSGICDRQNRSQKWAKKQMHVDSEHGQSEAGGLGAKQVNLKHCDNVAGVQQVDPSLR